MSDPRAQQAGVRNEVAKVIRSALLRYKSEDIGTILKAGEALGKAAAQHEQINKEQWAKIYIDEIEQLCAQIASAMSALVVLKNDKEVAGHIRELVEEELELLESNQAGKHLIEELRALRYESKDAARLAKLEPLVIRAVKYLKDCDCAGSEGWKDICDIVEAIDAAMKKEKP